MSCILIIDDDAHIRDVLRYALEAEKLTVLEAENGLVGLDVFKKNQPDIVILDIMMPEMNGLDVCRKIREGSHTPILFLSSRDSEIDRVLGLEMGGDDYLNKPFSPRELIARIKAMLRRLDYQKTTPIRSDDKTLRHGRLSLNTNTYQAILTEQSITLTTTEFNLLHLFIMNPQKVYTRDELIQADIFKDIISDRTIDSHIRRLRQKFTQAGCETVIQTVHGFGYTLGSCS